MKRLLLASLLVSAAACTGGERNQTGDCPADEVCSPLTPNGMHFTGVPLVGVPLLAEPKTTAIGGTQQIDLYKELDSGDIVPLDLPFAAMSDNGDALAIASAGPNAVVLEGIAAGRDLLRITEPDNDLLYDRYEVAAAALDHIDLVPATYESYVTGAPVAFYQGDISLGLALYTASDERLADDSLTLTVTGPQPTRSEWDSFDFAALGPGTLTGTLTAAGRSGPIDIEVVDAVDEVLPLSDSFPDTIHPGDQGEVCFHATAGAAESVLGLPWSFAATGQVTSVISLSANCFALQVNAPGDFTVIGTALGVSTTVQLTAVAAGAKPAPRVRSGAPAPTTADPLAGDSRGERARMME